MENLIKFFCNVIDIVIACKVFNIDRQTVHQYGKMKSDECPNFQIIRFTNALLYARSYRNFVTSLIENLTLSAYLAPLCSLLISFNGMY